MKSSPIVLLAVLLSQLMLISQTISAQSQAPKEQIKAEKLSDHIYVLTGEGGNVGLVVTRNGVYLIDDKFAYLSDKILAAVKKITPRPVSYLVNTHWHGDHTGGNENIARQGATIIAQDNVYQRMSTRQNRGGGRVEEPSPYAALPQITFSDNLTMHLDSTLQLMAIHVHNAHTDGDAMVYFPEENILHTGDVFFNGRYPFIDLNSGGSIDGIIKAVNSALFLVNKDTKIIPGHGSIASRQDLITYRDLLMTIRERVKNAKDSGKTLAEVQKMGLTKEWDKTQGMGKTKPNDMVESVYNSLK